MCDRCSEPPCIRHGCSAYWPASAHASSLNGPPDPPRIPSCDFQDSPSTSMGSSARPRKATSQPASIFPRIFLHGRFSWETQPYRPSPINCHNPRRQRHRAAILPDHGKLQFNRRRSSQASPFKVGSRGTPKAKSHEARPSKTQQRKATDPWQTHHGFKCARAQANAHMCLRVMGQWARQAIPRARQPQGNAQGVAWFSESLPPKQT